MSDLNNSQEQIIVLPPGADRMKEGVLGHLEISVG
jgi:hypothetical protein